MVANTGSKRDASSEADGAEGPSAVATITRMIRDLYAPNRSRTALGSARDDGLIIWSEMLGAVRNRERELAQGPGSTAKASTRRSPTVSGS